MPYIKVVKSHHLHSHDGQEHDGRIAFNTRRGYNSGATLPPALITVTVKYINKGTKARNKYISTISCNNYIARKAKKKKCSIKLEQNTALLLLVLVDQFCQKGFPLKRLLSCASLDWMSWEMHDSTSWIGSKFVFFLLHRDTDNCYLFVHHKIVCPAKCVLTLVAFVGHFSAQRCVDDCCRLLSQRFSPRERLSPDGPT